LLVLVLSFTFTLHVQSFINSFLPRCNFGGVTTTTYTDSTSLRSTPTVVDQSDTLGLLFDELLSQF